MTAARKPGDLPVPGAVIAKMRKHAFVHPWRGDTPLVCPRHFLDTEAIREPGRPTRIIVSFDHHYHGSGWFKNADYEQCLHLSISHPRDDRPRLWRPRDAPGLEDGRVGPDLETPDEREVWEWARAFFRDNVRMAWIEPAASVLDNYRMPNVVHARLYYEVGTMRPFIPEGEVYHPMRPWSAKVLESIGGDVH